MQSLWKDQEASRFADELALRVYTSRLLGREKTLVLHGGGNTSVKIARPNLFGEPETILYVKGSGRDLATIEQGDFSPVRLEPLLRLAQLDSLSDAQMVNALRCSMTDASAPTPSVEALLHGLLPHRFVDHTHADAVIAITNTPDGWKRIQALYGNRVVMIPYIMPGFALAKLCARMLASESLEDKIGMILMHHGVFSFGETARLSYERMIDLVSRAEEYLKGQGACIEAPAIRLPAPIRHDLAVLRQKVSEAAGFPVILTTENDASVMHFVRRADIATLSQQGPATPDHVIRTKRVPLLGREVQAYALAYKEYFAQYAPLSPKPLTMLDPAPRVILDPDLGMSAIGRTAQDASVVRDIYRHTIDIILRSAALGGYQALPAQDIFEIEYWELEQAKLRRSDKLPLFSGEIALVTGAASGIGKACVTSLLARGSAVVGLDINPDIARMHDRCDYLGLCCDITDEEAIRQALEQAAWKFGGLDMLILNAGIFPASCRIESLALPDWHKVMRINLEANLVLMREAAPLLQLAPAGGRIVVIGSKNVPAPGPGAAAYSVSKAALTQLARVAALELGKDRIRVNVLHPNMVFDTAIWTEELLRSRAAQYQMSVDEYKTHNILQAEITSRDVAELAAELCGPLFAKTTGAQIPLDGGNDRVI